MYVKFVEREFRETSSYSESSFCLIIIIYNIMPIFFYKYCMYKALL